MQTLLQTLLIQTLPEDTDPILQTFIETVLPAIEREFSLISALGGAEEFHYQSLLKQGDRKARETARKWANRPDQSLLVHVLNALLTAWNISQYLPSSSRLSDTEKRLLCLAMTLHDYDKAERGQKEKSQPPKASEVFAILSTCQRWGERLNFQVFWMDWQQYLLDIAFLAQNTHHGSGNNPIMSNWESDEHEFQIDDRRLNDVLRHLLAFGDIAVHMNDPADIVTTTVGDRLRDHLELLGINKKLIYHRVRDCRGLLTNQIHNAVVNLARNLDWSPILYFAQGAVYLTAQSSNLPELNQIREDVWETIIRGDSTKNQKGLEKYFATGDVGFVRDGKGLKVAPQTLELFSPADLICQLPEVIQSKVANAKDPATPKRLEKLPLNEAEREKLMQGADLRADRIAEFLILTQREFFEGCDAYAPQVLTLLKAEKDILPEQTAIQSGGVNYGWYLVAAHYTARHATLSLEQVSIFLSELAQKIADWAEENNLLKSQNSSTQAAFMDYLSRYLEIFSLSQQGASFLQELQAYTDAKAKNQPICSLSSGEAIAEDQLDSVVLFKPQQYSNKNVLGGGRIKRGISKIWSLEMLMRQAYWSAPSGKLEDQRPIFLYIFPAYVYSPQMAIAVRRLVQEFKRISLWEVRKQWLETGMNLEGLQNLPWRDEEDEAEAGRYGDEYSTKDLPFMAMTYTTTRGKTITDAWVEPAFLTLALPLLLGVKVVATPSPDPLYASDQEFRETAKLDGAAGFWSLLGLEESLRLQELEPALKRLLIAYSLYLDDPRQDLVKVVRDITTSVLNIFSIANKLLRVRKRSPTIEEISNYWKLSQIWQATDVDNGAVYIMELIEELTKRFRVFYRVGEDSDGNVYSNESSHSILRPLSIALDVILSSPHWVDKDSLVKAGSGDIRNALDRLKGKDISKRVLRDDKSQELVAIHKFMSFCVENLLGDSPDKGFCRGDRALLQENRNRIKSGAEFAYRWLALQEKQAQQSSSATQTSNEEAA